MMITGADHIRPREGENIRFGIFEKPLSIHCMFKSLDMPAVVLFDSKLSKKEF